MRRGRGGGGEGCSEKCDHADRTHRFKQYPPFFRAFHKVYWRTHFSLQFNEGSSGFPQERRFRRHACLNLCLKSDFCLFDKFSKLFLRVYI